MSDNIASRFNKVLEDVYGGNLQRMAVALGVDRSTCSRYKSGIVQPSRRTLLALSRETGVDLEWLEKGGNTPILYRSRTGDIQLHLPMLDELVEEANPENAPSFRGAMMQTPAHFVAKGRYWLRLRQDLPEVSIRAEDYLLIEVCSAEPVSKCQVDRLLAIRQDERRAVRRITKKDLDTNPRPLAIGTVLMLNRYYT